MSLDTQKVPLLIVAILLFTAVAVAPSFDGYDERKRLAFQPLVKKWHDARPRFLSALFALLIFETIAKLAWIVCQTLGVYTRQYWLPIASSMVFLRWSNHVSDTNGREVDLQANVLIICAWCIVLIQHVPESGQVFTEYSRFATLVTLIMLCHSILRYAYMHKFNLFIEEAAVANLTAPDEKKTK